MGIHNGPPAAGKDHGYRASRDIVPEENQPRLSSYLPPRGQMLKHVAGLRETAGVPGEIPFAIGMLNVQPDDITRQVVIIEALIHFQNISLIPIVCCSGGSRGRRAGQCLGPCRFGVGGRGHSWVRLNLEPMEMPRNSGRYKRTGPENRPRHRTAENAQSPGLRGDKVRSRAGRDSKGATYL